MENTAPNREGEARRSRAHTHPAHALSLRLIVGFAYGIISQEHVQPSIMRTAEQPNTPHRQHNYRSCTTTPIRPDPNAPYAHYKTPPETRRNRESMTQRTVPDPILTLHLPLTNPPDNRSPFRHLNLPVFIISVKR